MCEKWGFQRTEKWYMYNPEKILESKECKILWNFPLSSSYHMVLSAIWEIFSEFLIFCNFFPEPLGE